MLSMFLLLPISLDVVLPRHYFNMLISVALMNSHNRFCKQSTVHYQPPPRLKRGKWLTILLAFLLLWTIFFKGGTNTNNQSQLTGRVFVESPLHNYTGTGSNSGGRLLTLQSGESNLRRDLLQCPTQITVPLSHLTSLWTVCLAVCLWPKDQKH